MSPKRVIVFGASGVQGRAQVAALVRAGHDVTAISRNPKPTILDGVSVKTAAADYNDNAAIAQVLKGAEIVFLNLPSTSFNQSPPILAAAQSIGTLAKEAGIKLIIFNTSMPIPLVPQDVMAQNDRREMRTLVRNSGVPVISIEPVVYLDNLLEGWALPPIRDRNTVVYCHKPELQSSWICHDDVAQLMVAAMNRPDLAGRNFAVGGPETVTLQQLTEKLSRAWKRDLKCENQTVSDFCDKIGATMQGRGLETDKIVKEMFKAYTYYNESPTLPFKIDMGPVLELLPVKLTSIEEWARTHVPASN